MNILEMKVAKIGINLYDLRGSKTSAGFMVLEWELINSVAVIDIITEMIRIDNPRQTNLIHFIQTSRFPVGAS